ncbi:hypothetical protein [Pseudomonas laurylsulfatiphila]
MALDTFVEMYLDWLNNFLSVEAFAAHYGLSLDKANQIIEAGRTIAAIDL